MARAGRGNGRQDLIVATHALERGPEDRLLEQSNIDTVRARRGDSGCLDELECVHPCPYPRKRLRDGL
jgi:hypothetical protein